MWAAGAGPGSRTLENALMSRGMIFLSDHFRFEFHCGIDCCDTEFSHLKLDTTVLFYSFFNTDIENNNSLPSI